MQLIVRIKRDHKFLDMPMLYSSQQKLEEEIDNRLQAIDPIQRELKRLERRRTKIHNKSLFGLITREEEDECNRILTSLDILYPKLDTEAQIESDIDNTGRYFFSVNTSGAYKPTVEKLDDWFDKGSGF